MKLKWLVGAVAMLAVVGCSKSEGPGPAATPEQASISPHATNESIVTYHVANMGTKEPCSYRLAEDRAERLLATRIREVKMSPSTNDICFATIHHRGVDVDVIMDQSVGYPSGIYAQVDGRRFAVPGKWLCFLPGLGSTDDKTFDIMMKTLERTKAASNEAAQVTAPKVADPGR